MYTPVIRWYSIINNNTKQYTHISVTLQSQIIIQQECPITCKMLTFWLLFESVDSIHESVHGLPLQRTHHLSLSPTC